MREYKPIRTERGRILSRKKQMGRLILLQYLNSHAIRWPNKWSAKVFYTKESVDNALFAMQKKDEPKKSD